MAVPGDAEEQRIANLARGASHRDAQRRLGGRGEAARSNGTLDTTIIIMTAAWSRPAANRKWVSQAATQPPPQRKARRIEAAQDRVDEPQRTAETRRADSTHHPRAQSIDCT